MIRLGRETQTRDTLVKLRTALKGKFNNIFSAHRSNLDKEALSSEKKLNEILAMKADAMVKLEPEVVIEEIRSLNQRTAKLDKTRKAAASGKGTVAAVLSLIYFGGWGGPRRCV